MKSHAKRDRSAPVPAGNEEDSTPIPPPVPREEELALPFERDQSPDAVDPGESHQVIEQAARDVRRGLRDTERRGIPSDVPGPGPAPEDSPGAAVPAEGIDEAAHRRRRRTPSLKEGR
jgi:hypothetical protein